MADGEAEGVVSGVLVFVVEVAFRGEGGADTVHGEVDRHGGIPCMEKDRWVDIVLPEEIQGDSAGVLIRVEENKVFVL